MRKSKGRAGKAIHVLSAFCGGLQGILGRVASRGKGLEIPDALKLLEHLDLAGKIVTGDAMLCQKSIAAKIVERGGDYILSVKDNQKKLREDIETAVNEPPPQPLRWRGREGAWGYRAANHRCLAGKAAGTADEWPVARQICRLRWSRQIKKNGQWQETQETVYLITTSLLPTCATPQAILKAVSASPTRAIEYFQDDKTGPSVSSQVFTKSPRTSHRHAPPPDQVDGLLRLA